MPLSVSSLPHHDGVDVTMGASCKITSFGFKYQERKRFLFQTGHQEHYIEQPMTVLGYGCLAHKKKQSSALCKTTGTGQSSSPSIASLYELSPKPHITPLQAAEMKEWWRKSSRWWTLEICTSTTGHFMARMQSCRAMLVWV